MATTVDQDFALAKASLRSIARGEGEGRLIAKDTLAKLYQLEYERQVAQAEKGIGE
jgi:hypothetical protein